MRFRYIGAGDDPPRSIVFRGIPFELNGDPVDVTDEATIAKMKGNRSFETARGRPRASEAAKPVTEPADETDGDSG